VAADGTGPLLPGRLHDDPVGAGHVVAEHPLRQVASALLDLPGGAGLLALFGNILHNVPPLRAVEADDHQVVGPLLDAEGLGLAHAGPFLLAGHGVAPSCRATAS